MRIWFASVNQLQPQFSPADDGDYYQRALRFATTGAYIDDFWLIRPPLHVFLFALMIRISIILGNIDGIWLIRVAQTVMIVLTIPMVYDLARRLFQPRAGLIAAAITAVWYPLVELPVHLFSEPTFFFFLVLHLWLLIWWRDSRRWYLLAGSGLALGLGALARSPTLYGAPFVLLWLVLEERRYRRSLDTSAAAPALSLVERWRSYIPLRAMAIVLVACALMVVPWTIRNYLVYEKIILVDTIGPVNLWLHVEKYPEKGVEILKTMPQGERQVFAVNDTMRMFQADPVGFWQLLWRNAWFHFQHIWKAQFLEDMATKRSYYGRPLQATWPLGVAGDLIWFAFTATGLAALAAPIGRREGAFRWLALCWLLYTIVAMMIMHIEPRYLLPVWLILILYGAWWLSNPMTMLRTLWQQRWHGLLALLMTAAFLGLSLSYRNYPELIQRTATAEMHRAAAAQAFAADDYDRARAELEQAMQTHNGLVDQRAELAFALIAQQQYDAAQELMGNRDSQRIALARGDIARRQQKTELARPTSTRPKSVPVKMCRRWHCNGSAPRRPAAWCSVMASTSAIFRASPQVRRLIWPKTIASPTAGCRARDGWCCLCLSRCKLAACSPCAWPAAHPNRRRYSLRYVPMQPTQTRPNRPPWLART